MHALSVTIMHPFIDYARVFGAKCNGIQPCQVYLPVTLTLWIYEKLYYVAVMSLTYLPEAILDYTGCLLNHVHYNRLQVQIK